MARALRRNPKRGRVWYAPEQRRIPRMVTREQLAARAYAAAGPKAGVRPRQDAIETLYAGLRYLHVRGARERDGAGSGDFATTAGQTIDGLMHELSRRSAKPWDPRVGAGLASWPRRQVRVRKYGSAVVKLLDELAGCGLLVWGGERDNNGLWWRLRIRLLDPDGPLIEPGPWMRPSPRLLDLQPDDTEPCGGGGPQAASAGRGRHEPVPELQALYDLAAAHGHDRPRFAGRLERRIVAAADRYRAHAHWWPRGLSEDPWAVLANMLEQHTLAGDGDPFVAALPYFDALTRRMHNTAKDSPDTPTPVGSSQNSAALQNRPNGLTANARYPSASASTTGASAHGDSDDHADTAIAEQAPAEADNDELVRERGTTAPDLFEALARRVAARERLLEALSGPARARDLDTLERARAWPADSAVPVGLVTAAAAVLHGGRRPWLSDDQIARLRRGAARYACYRDQRPAGAPPAPAAALMALVEHRPAAIGHPLAWAIAQLDLLTKRMRRHAKRGAGPERLAAARQRAGRRQDRRRHATTAAFWRRPNARRQVAVDDAVDRLAARVTRHELRCPLAWTLAHTARRLHHTGVAISAEQLRCELRDQLLLVDAPVRHLADVDGPASALAPPEHFDPTGPLDLGLQSPARRAPLSRTP